jgi:hypothetical protein
MASICLEENRGGMKDVCGDCPSWASAIRVAVPAQVQGCRSRAAPQRRIEEFQGVPFKRGYSFAPSNPGSHRARRLGPVSAAHHFVVRYARENEMLWLSRRDR